MIKAKPKNLLRSSRDPPESEMQKTDKKIKELTYEIAKSKQKIEQQISKMDDHIGNIIKVRLVKFVALHHQIIESKDLEYRQLKEHYEVVRLSQLNQNVKKLQKTIVKLEEEIQRINKVKEMLRKEGEQLKIQLEIKEKQVYTCHKREKELMKQVWILQEDIKDIYQEPNEKKEESERCQYHSNNQQLHKSYINEKKNEGQKNKIQYRYKTVAKVVHTEPTESEERKPTQITAMIENKYLNFKQSGITKLKERLGISHKRRLLLNKSKGRLAILQNSSSTFSHQPIQTISSNKDMYEDLRESIRNSHRKEVNADSQTYSNGHLTLGKFKLVCLYGLRIMKQIQKVTIQRYGCVHEIDEQSIQLLLTLFRSQNALKILQIVLFNYSLQALEEIKEQEESLIVENQYDIPSLNNSPKPFRPPQLLERRKFRIDRQTSKKKYVNPCFQQN